MKPRIRLWLLICIPVLALLISAVCTCFFWYSKIIETPSVIITNKKLHFNAKKSHIIIENFLWDTGTEKSIFCKETAKKRRIGFFCLNDTYVTKLEPLYYSDSIIFPFGIAVKMIYPIVDTNRISHFFKSNIKCLIGMNIINSTNWLIDFTQNIIYADTLFSPDCLPKISVSYKNRLCPVANIYVEDIKIDNVVIDAGSYGDLILSTSDIKSINNKITPYDTNTVISDMIYSHKIKNREYIYNNIKINGHNIDTLHIEQTLGRPCIGLDFFRKFDKVYLDTKEQVFKFY